jgi:pimeloyl-ACP methyl ester carboxylesterase
MWYNNQQQNMAARRMRDSRAAMGFLETAEVWEVEELKTGHYVHVGKSTARSSSPRIVFLHGLSQSLECWLPTATQLSTGPLRAECLLIDLVGHGKTAIPGGAASRCRPDVMCRQVGRVLEDAGWMDGHRKMIFAGLSLGAAISLLWAEEHLDRVARLVRVAAGGLKEQWGFFPAIARSAGAVSLVSRISKPVFDPSCLVTGLLAPDYGVDQRMPEILRRRNIPVSVVGGTWDYVHRARVDRWKPQAVLFVHGWEHIRMCMRLDSLKLADRPELWVGAGRHQTMAAAHSSSSSSSSSLHSKL